MLNFFQPLVSKWIHPTSTSFPTKPFSAPFCSFCCRGLGWGWRCNRGAIGARAWWSLALSLLPWLLLRLQTNCQSPCWKQTHLICWFHVSCLCQDLSHQTCFKDAQNQEQTLDWSACLDIDALVRSQMYKDEAGNWRCSGCDYFSKSSTSVSEHIESKHVYGPGFACHICQHVCPTRKALKMHIFRGKHYWYHLSWIKRIWSI